MIESSFGEGIHEYIQMQYDLLLYGAEGIDKDSLENLILKRGIVWAGSGGFVVTGKEYQGSFDDWLIEVGATREEWEGFVIRAGNHPTYEFSLFVMLAKTLPEPYISVTLSDGQNLNVPYSDLSQNVKLTNNGTYTVVAKGVNGEQGKTTIEISNLYYEKYSEIYTQTKEYVDDEGNKAIIPEGFAVGISEGINKIENGLVIQDKDTNQFVWIPVEKAIVTEEEIEQIKEEDTSITTDLSAVQKIVDNGTYPMAVEVTEIDKEGNTKTNYKGILYNIEGTSTLTITVYDWTDIESFREPDKVSSDENTTWTETLYQDSYNSMVKSVSENGGFYVGRYEISKATYTDADGNTITYAQTKLNQEALVGISWYNLYKYQKNYSVYNSNLGVTSEMIWGSQWDQMMIFVNGKNDGSGTETPFYVAEKRIKTSR